MNLVLRLNKKAFSTNEASTTQCWSLLGELRTVFSMESPGACNNDDASSVFFTWAEKIIAARSISKLSAKKAQSVAQELADGAISFTALRALAYSYRIRLRVILGPFTVTYGESSSPLKQLIYRPAKVSPIEIAQDGSLYAISKYSLKSLKEAGTPSTKDEMYATLQKGLNNIKGGFLSSC
jgi:hypothetical protein